MTAPLEMYALLAGLLIDASPPPKSLRDYIRAVPLLELLYGYHETAREVTEYCEQISLEMDYGCARAAR
ncbi:MAG: hypothetical protein NUW12_09480 [Firmicutes bacterium]|jgi:hypothetical protein|nr:hypothetical protein [Bacillota bacterium]MDH7496142.1 hypothetical protein [Bacillota bacterium]